MKRRRLLDDLSQDIRDHIEEETQDNIARGMTPDEARYAAMRKFGNVLRMEEDTRAVWVPRWVDEVRQDARYAFRALRRGPGFTIAATLTLGLGIGINTAVFSTINAVLLRPLPYPDAERLVVYSDGVSASKAEHFKSGIEPADFFEWRARAKSFVGLAGYQCRDVTLASAAGAMQVRAAFIAGDLWKITAVRAASGRLFGPDDSQGSIVISYRTFQRHFQADSRAIGSTVHVDGKPMTIAGVLPGQFRFPFPQDLQPAHAAPEDVEAYLPAPPPLRGSPERMRMMFVAGKLKPAVSMDSALKELQALQASVLREYPDRWFAGIERMRLVTARERMVGGVRTVLVILQTAGILVLLIACVNIANLLLARAASRRTEIAVRKAIGAGQCRLVRQFLAEGLALAAAGGAAGLMLAGLAMTVMARSAAQAIPRLGEISIDVRVLAFAAVVTLSSGVVFGLAPAIGLWASTLQDALKQGARSSSTPASIRVRQVLVASELALALVLLTGAGLMVKSFWRMYENPPGFSPEHTLLMRVSLSGPQFDDGGAYVREVVERVQSVPGVISAGAAKSDVLLLQSSNGSAPPVVERFQESLVSPGYFGAIGMRLTRGRWIRSTDTADAAIINETMARLVFGDEDALGRRIERLGRPVRVVGVVANLKYSKLDAEPGPEMYKVFPEGSNTGRGTLLVVVRVPGDPLGIASAAQTIVAGVNPAQPVYGVETLEQALAASIAPRRFNLLVLGVFAAAALLMAVIGIYGVISYLVTQRTREIGVRMALGARPSSVVRLVVRHGMAMVLYGILAGLLAAAGFTRALASLLYGVQPHDEATFVFVALCLAMTALLACLVPALRAARVDPVTALRYE